MGRDAGLRDAAIDANVDEDAGPGDAGVPAIQPLCSRDGFCWEAPWPQGETLRSAWAASATDVWLVGDHGSLLHFDGARFVAHALPDAPALTSVHGTGANDVWAVGDRGLVFHFDGTAWRSEDLSKLIGNTAELSNVGVSAIYAASRDAVWAVGWSGVNALVLHYDGTSWTNQLTNMQSDQPLRAVWGVSDKRVWAVGDKGVILSFDGTMWQLDKSATGAALRSVHALSETNVWAVGDNGTAVRWDGLAWKSLNMGLSGALHGVLVNRVPPPPPAAGAGGMGAAAAGSGGAGAGGSAGAPPPMAPQGPWLTYAFGEKGHVFRYNGSVWAQLPSGSDVTFYAGARLTQDALLAVGEHGQVTRLMDDSRRSMSQGDFGNHLGVCRGDNAVWAVGDGIVKRKLGAGETWTTMNRPNARALYSVFCDDATVWAVGTAGNIARSKGDTFEAVTSAAASESWLRSVYGAGSSLWVVGDGGLALTAAAGGFVKVTTPVRTALLDVWGNADDHFWAVGDAGVVLRWDGMSWLKIPTGPMMGVTQNLRAVWGSSADDVWVAGAEGTLLHWTGKRFEAQTLDGKFTINDLWGRAKNDVYAVGSSGVVLHFDGSSWQTLESGTSSALQSVSGDAQHVYVAGLNGVLLVRETL